MKPASHVASPLPQQTLAYLSLAAPSASHCCQECIAGLLITCQWAWSKNAHPEAKRVSYKSWKSQQALCRWAILGVCEGHSHGHVQTKGSKVREALEEVWGLLAVHLPSALMNKALGKQPHRFSTGCLQLLSYSNSRVQGLQLLHGPFGLQSLNYLLSGS